MSEAMIELDDDAYLVITPFGAVQAFFDEDAMGVRLVGASDAVAHIKDVLQQVTGSDGRMLSVDSCTPDDFYRFCQPDWSGIKIDPPLDVAILYFLERQKNEQPPT